MSKTEGAAKGATQRVTNVWLRLQRLPQTVLMALVQGYRLLLSPWLGSDCRFTPTCSAYALRALLRHGAIGGSYLTAARLVRCHPWCQGGTDNVPAHIAAPKLFTRLFGSAVPPSGPSVTDDSLSSPVSKTLL
jgi:uncharacterized protein